MTGRSVARPRMGHVSAVLRKDLTQFWRDKQTLALRTALPVLIILLFGYVYSGGVEHLPVVVANLDRSHVSWQLVNRFVQCETFQIVKYADSIQEAERSVVEGQALGAMIIPDGFEEAITNYGTGYVVIITDGSVPQISAAILSAAYGVVTDFYYSITVRSQSVYSPTVKPLSIVLFGAGLRMIDYFIPLVMGMMLLQTPSMLVAQSFAREKEMGTMEQLIVSPISTAELILGKLLANFVVTAGDIFLILLTAKVAFNILIRGSIFEIIFLCFLALLSSLSLGLLLSTVSRTQMQAVQTVAFAFIPMMLFSGFLVPVESLPLDLRVVSYVIPLYHFNVAMRTLMVKGLSMSACASNVLFLVGYTILTVVASIMIFRKRLE